MGTIALDNPPFIDSVHVPNEDGPLLLPRIFQNTLFQLVDHRTPPPHLALQWTRDDSQITQRSGSPRAAGASRGGGRRSAEPAYPAISETPARWSRARPVEEDSQGQRPTYGATGHHHSDPHIQPTPLTTPHRLPLAAKTLVCCVLYRLSLPLNKTLWRLKGSEMEVELDDIRDHRHPEEQAAFQASLSSSPAPKLAAPPTPQRPTSRTVLFNAAVDLEGGAGGIRGGSRAPNEPVYAAAGETPTLGSRAASIDGGRPLRASPIEEDGSRHYPPYTATSTDAPSDPDYQPPATPRRP
ncbi:hypothetical protein BKA70DRAFT_1445347 [Coprinopsis sp. MPI-PUGE-AT-0042]|nr:hypothetical protein BKA70DRAFT_1445347 [Coprinopsis sp. MPI-PUGE-AT-0042]